MKTKLDTISENSYLKAVAIDNSSDEVIFHLRFRYVDYLRYCSNVLDDERRSLKAYIVRYANYFARTRDIKLDNVEVFVSVDNVHDDEIIRGMYFRR